MRSLAFLSALAACCLGLLAAAPVPAVSAHAAPALRVDRSAFPFNGLISDEELARLEAGEIVIRNIRDRKNMCMLRKVDASSASTWKPTAMYSRSASATTSRKQR